MNALRNLGPIEAVRCVGVVPLGAHPPAEGQVDARGLRRLALRLAPVPALLQDAEREGVGRARAPRSRPTGARSASRTSRCSAPSGRRSSPSGCASAQAKSKQVTSLIEEFNYPKYGPGMMWERCAELVTAQGTKVVFDSTVTKIEHADGRAVAVTAVTDGAPHALRVHRRDLVDADRRSCCAAMDPPVPADVLEAAADACATATSSPSRSSCPKRTASPTTGSTSTTRRRGRPHPELRQLVAVHGEGRPHVPRPRVLRERGRRHVDEGRRRPHRARQARAATRSACSTTRQRRGGLRRADAEGVSDLRRGLQGERRRRSRRGSREHTPNVYPVGRNGMHRYNNQDHSMFTAMLSVENIFGAHHDVWSVNVEAEYHEERVDDVN